MYWKGVLDGLEKAAAYGNGAWEEQRRQYLQDRALAERLANEGVDPSQWPAEKSAAFPAVSGVPKNPISALALVERLKSMEREYDRTHPVDGFDEWGRKDLGFVDNPVSKSMAPMLSMVANGVDSFDDLRDRLTSMSNGDVSDVIATMDPENIRKMQVSLHSYIQDSGLPGLFLGSRIGRDLGWSDHGQKFLDALADVYQEAGGAANGERSISSLLSLGKLVGDNNRYLRYMKWINPELEKFVPAFRVMSGLDDDSISHLSNLYAVSGGSKDVVRRAKGPVIKSPLKSLLHRENGATAPVPSPSPSGADSPAVPAPSSTAPAAPSSPVVSSPPAVTAVPSVPAGGSVKSSAYRDELVKIAKDLFNLKDSAKNAAKSMYGPPPRKPGQSDLEYARDVVDRYSDMADTLADSYPDRTVKVRGVVTEPIPLGKLKLDVPVSKDFLESLRGSIDNLEAVNRTEGSGVPSGGVRRASGEMGDLGERLMRRRLGKGESASTGAVLGLLSQSPGLAGAGVGALLGLGAGAIGKKDKRSKRMLILSLLGGALGGVGASAGAGAYAGVKARPYAEKAINNAGAIMAGMSPLARTETAASLASRVGADKAKVLKDIAVAVSGKDRKESPTLDTRMAGKYRKGKGVKS